MPISKLFDSLNAGYAQELYEQYARDPESVPEAWRKIFSRGAAEAVESGLMVPEGLRGNGDLLAATMLSVAQPPAPVQAPEETRPEPRTPAVSAPTDEGRASAAAVVDPLTRLLPVVARAAALIQAFRDHGHQLATIDPLGSEPPGHPQLDPSFFGMTMEELGEIPTSIVLGNGNDEPLSQTLERLRQIYCGSVGYQFEHLEDPVKVQWLWNEVESETHTQPLGREDRIRLLRRLAAVEGMERFLHRAYLGQKRFSVEGNDMLVPMLDFAIEGAAEVGGETVVMGMAHRGRLNVLAHIVGIDYKALLREFEGAPQSGGPLNHTGGTGDVKYHHGARGEYGLEDGKTMSVILAPNPSHLEFVNPVVEGMARVLQFGGSGKDVEQKTERVVPILIHGDAAFAAEGVVAETLNLTRLRGYSTGGTIHIIANNQIGFTTLPLDGRSTRYASDVAKGYDIPILHVNADDPEACVGAVRLAMAYRQKFQDDMVIDLVGYRRHGHNEGDEPAYTQPKLYEKIADHPSVLALWVNRLVEEGTIAADDAQAIEEKVAAGLRDAQDAVRQEEHEHAAAPPPSASAQPAHADTPVKFSVLAEVNEDAFAPPEGFTVHPKLGRQLEKKRTSFAPDFKLDWGQAEALAFGSLLKDGVPIRMTGQDSQRGTFSQRHLVLHDVETGDAINPLARTGDARFEIFNSPLSEIAALGFEYGYSVQSSKDLVLWEAQFGDFVNVAQTVIDQFISSGRAKWGQVSGLTLLLPHGHEGQGPEHSSARLERFLQLCAEDNMRVAYPSTPSQYFHLLRRQALATPQRPLIVMTPKSLLRHPLATSPVSELSEGGFRRVLDDPRMEGKRESVTRLILCSGKFYYDLRAADGDGRSGAALGRVEELYPFPAEELTEIVTGYPQLEEVVWTQEEPRNMGALSFIGPRLRAVVPRHVRLRHVSRPERASPAEGKAKAHEAEQLRLVNDALQLG